MAVLSARRLACTEAEREATAASMDATHRRPERILVGCKFFWTIDHVISPTNFMKIDTCCSHKHNMITSSAQLQLLLLLLLLLLLRHSKIHGQAADVLPVLLVRAMLDAHADVLGPPKPAPPPGRPRVEPAGGAGRVRGHDAELLAEDGILPAGHANFRKDTATSCIKSSSTGGRRRRRLETHVLAQQCCCSKHTHTCNLLVAANSSSGKQMVSWLQQAHAYDQPNRLESLCTW